jgi:hypothetical protein
MKGHHSGTMYERNNNPKLRTWHMYCCQRRCDGIKEISSRQMISFTLQTQMEKKMEIKSWKEIYSYCCFSRKKNSHQIILYKVIRWYNLHQHAIDKIT